MKRDSDALSLDAIERTPEALDTLPPAARLTLLERAEVLAARLRARALAASANGAPPPASPAAERALRVREAAQVLGMSVDYVHRHWHTLGFYKDDDGHLKVAARTLVTHIERRSRAAR